MRFLIIKQLTQWDVQHPHNVRMLHMCWVFGSVDISGVIVDCDRGIRIGDLGAKKLSSYLYVGFWWLGGVAKVNELHMHLIYTG